MNSLRQDYNRIEDFSREEFLRTDTPLAPAYAWIWDGEMTLSGVRSRLRRLYEGGIRAFYILPIPKDYRPGQFPSRMSPDYLTEEYLSLVRQALREARTLGMYAWLYDEGGWPSGSACGRTVKKDPRLCRKSLSCREQTFPKGECFRPEGEDLAAFSKKENRAVVPGEPFREDTVCRVFSVTLRPGPGCPMTDCTEQGAGETFISLTHEKYRVCLEKLPPGPEISLMFTDEPSAGAFPWPTGFDRCFSEKYGYDLRDHLPALWDMEKDASGRDLQARQDYRELCGDLFRENYLAPIRDWCGQNGLLSTGHLDLDHRSDGTNFCGYGTVLEQLRALDVPGVDVIWRQIDLPGNDLPACREGNGFFERFASSAAAQTGSRFAMSESLSVYGASMTGTLSRFVLNHEMVRGINLFSVMCIPDSPAVPEALASRPVFMPELPGFDHLRGMNDYLTRASYLMSLGTPGGRTALFYPARDIWAGGTRQHKALRAFERTGQALERARVDFDVIDEDGLRACKKEHNALCMGLARYEHLIIPEGATVPEDIREKTRDMSHRILPAVLCDNEKLRVRKRDLPGGKTLYMLFCESENTETCTLTFPEGAEKLLLDPQNGRILSDGETEFTFAPGEAKFFLFTGNTGYRKPEKTHEKQIYAFADFSLERSARTEVDSKGIRRTACREPSLPAKPGAWAPYLGKDFSGEGVYTASLTLDRVPEPGERWKLSAAGVEVSARVFLNGKPLGILWAEPFELTFDGKIFERKTDCTLRVEVANTFLNCIDPAIKPEMKDFLRGHYAEKLTAFDAVYPPGGLYGPVLLTDCGWSDAPTEE